MAGHKPTSQAVIYALIDPRDEAVRYIGWAMKPARRLLQHISEAITGGTSHKCRWILALRASGHRPAMKILETVQKEHVLEREVFWIAKAREDGADLTNLTDGGDVPPHGWNRGLSKETDPRVARAAEGLRRAMIGNKNGRFVRHTDEHKARMRAAMKERRSSPGFQERINAAKRARPQTSWMKGLTAATDPRIAAMIPKLVESHKGQRPWNAGLTKDSDPRMAIISAKVSQSLKGNIPWNKGRKK